MNYRKLQLRCEELHNELDALLGAIELDADNESGEEETSAAEVLDALQEAVTALEAAGLAAEAVADNTPN